MTEILPASLSTSLDKALDLLLHGGLVAFPTDTVYGLAAMLTIPQAIDQLFVVKGREASKAIAVLVGDLQALTQVTAEMSSAAQQLAQRFWPGPLTLVVARHPALPKNLSPEASSPPTVGVRMPDHPHALALLKRSGPLAVTSANLSGKANTSSAQEVYEQLHDRIPLILDGGNTPGGAPSTVVDCTGTSLKILRAGPIKLEQILSIQDNLS